MSKVERRLGFLTWLGLRLDLDIGLGTYDVARPKCP